MISTSEREEVSAFAAPSVAAASSRRALLATFLGNALEVYDFTVFSFFSAIIGRQFFPMASPTLSLIASLATFGAGFVARPVGAIVFGQYADRRGRKAALALTIALMAAGTAVVALTPSYEQLGLAAPILLLIGRLLQGLSAGAEIGVTSAFLLEIAAPSRRCFNVSWQAASQGAAALLGAIAALTIFTALPEADIETYGWRIPLLLGTLIGPIGWYVRRHLDEPSRVSNTQTAAGEQRNSFSIFTVAVGALVMMGSTATTYIVIFHMPTWLVTVVHLPRLTSFVAACAAGATLLIVAPLAGGLADRIPNRRVLPMACAIAALVLVLPVFNLLVHRPALPTLVIGVVALVACVAVSAGAGGALLLEGLPQEFRATGMSLIYSIGVTIFGGLSPLLVTCLGALTNDPRAPAWYLALSTLVSALAIAVYPRRA